jgi:hypothetical protein
MDNNKDVYVHATSGGKSEELDSGILTNIRKTHVACDITNDLTGERATINHII